MICGAQRLPTELALDVPRLKAEALSCCVVDRRLERPRQPTALLLRERHDQAGDLGEVRVEGVRRDALVEGGLDLLEETAVLGQALSRNGLGARDFGVG